MVATFVTTYNRCIPNMELKRKRKEKEERKENRRRKGEEREKENKKEITRTLQKIN